MASHDARVRYCIQVGVPREHLRDDIRCPACDELHALMHLDPDVSEVLTRDPWCESCTAGDSGKGVVPQMKKSIHGGCTIEDGTTQCDECGEDWAEEMAAEES